VPYVPLPHPFVERLIGTLRRECLGRTLFWTTTDLEAKLLDFQHYYNEHRTHAGRKEAPAGNGRQRRSLTGKSQLLSMAEALSRLIPNADGRLILVIRHGQDNAPQNFNRFKERKVSCLKALSSIPTAPTNALSKIARGRKTPMIRFVREFLSGTSDSRIGETGEKCSQRHPRNTLRLSRLRSDLRL
jgi:hypothetical protein